MMRIVAKTKYLLPFFIIALTIAAIELPKATPGQVLADGPPTTAKDAAQGEEVGTLTQPSPVEGLAQLPFPGAPDGSNGTEAEFDDSTHGTY
jgi:hypothetical protein